MEIKRFSRRQLEALTWWCGGSPHRSRDAVICDGAVRSGKTLCLSLSFVAWAFARFHSRDLALCGKTISSLRRNLLLPLTALLEELGFQCRHRVTQNRVDITWQGKTNRFYLFGGKDEGSAALIQGITLAGVLMDEVALMPRSFVEQALARCSVEDSKFWFSCNPGHPGHWFYTEWICRREEKNACYLHFTMADNPALSPEILRRYQRLYTGVFHQRYVQGRWVATHGAVYPMFDPKLHVTKQIPPCSRYWISCDYGTVNPSSFGLWGQNGSVWYRIREFYHSSRATGQTLTDEEYGDALEQLAGDLPIEAVIIDPSAASFLQCIRRRGKFPAVPAKNSVVDGIRAVSSALRSGRLRFHSSCRDLVREFGLYRWDLTASGDRPVQEDDHAMDDLRYFVTYALAESGGGFFAHAVRRERDCLPLYPKGMGVGHM